MFYEIELTTEKQNNPQTFLLFSPCEITDIIIVFVLMREVEKLGFAHIFSITPLNEEELNEYHTYYKSLPFIKI